MITLILANVEANRTLPATCDRPVLALISFPPRVRESARMSETAL